MCSMVSLQKMELLLPINDLTLIQKWPQLLTLMILCSVKKNDRKYMYMQLILLGLLCTCTGTMHFRLKFDEFEQINHLNFQMSPVFWFVKFVERSKDTMQIPVYTMYCTYSLKEKLKKECNEKRSLMVYLWLLYEASRTSMSLVVIDHSEKV